VAALCLAGGCIIEPPDSDYPPPSNDGDGWGSGWGGNDGSSGYGCRSDTECSSGYVCARNGNCSWAADVRVVHVLWTVNGQPASDAACTSAPKLDITFSASNLMFGFSPVPCDAGKFTVDKIPNYYTNVSLARAGDDYGGDAAAFDTSGNATLDLPY
jgi:hypothetical protein